MPGLFKILKSRGKVFIQSCNLKFIFKLILPTLKFVVCSSDYLNGDQYPLMLSPFIGCYLKCFILAIDELIVVDLL